MKYHTLLFDVDDTLLDFRQAEKTALRKTFQEAQLPLTATLEQAYRDINQQLWQQFEKGLIDKATLENTRFGLACQAAGYEIDSQKMGKCYREFLGEGYELLGNSKMILEQLVSRYDLYVVTNGVAKTQHQRLKGAQIFPYFKQVFVSETIGYPKPMKEYFDYVFQRIPHFDSEKTLLIGDSLSADIAGGNQSNIHTAWLNANATQATDAIQPTYELRKLEDLLAILETP